MSRCLRIQFKKATEEELIRSFKRIIKREKLEAETEALSLIAGLSDGSFRDGVKILEEMTQITKGKKITKELVEKNYSIAGTQYRIAQIIKAMENKDVKNGLEVINKLVQEGIEMGNFMQGLIETLHNSLLSKAGVEVISGSSTFTVDNLKLEIGEIKKLIELLSQAKSELKYAVLPQIPLELVIVEWGLQTQKNAEQNVPVEPAQTVQRNSALNSVVFGDRTTISKQNQNSKGTQVVGMQPKLTQQELEKYSENVALWNALIDKVKSFNHSVAGVLRGCSIKSYDGKTLLLQTNFKFHKDKLSEEKTQAILKNACKEVTKKNVKIEIVLKEVK
jgi:DNA polymerase-3 subunit gamma/tau